MGMNIKNEEAHRLALEISARTGETLTATVLRALRELAEREQSGPDCRAARMAALERWDAAHPIPDGLKPLPDDEIYDLTGAPK